MIYTCTMNPAIDMYVEVDQLEPNVVNRTNDEDYQANGKGINVSMMLKKLGLDSTALGFIAGFTGSYIEEALKTSNIPSDFVHTEGITRINVFVNAESEYKIVNRGPSINRSQQHQLLDKIKAIPSGSTLMVSGSLSSGIPESIIVDIAEVCYRNHVKLVLDTSIASVMDALAYEPYLLKPNDEELADFYNLDKPLTEQDIFKYGQDLLTKGARQVIISRGEKGAVYMSNEQWLKTTSPQGTVVNTACSGDAMLAAFIAQQFKDDTLADALRCAASVGASTAFSRGLSDLNDIDELQKEVTVTQLEEG